ncbi:DUF6556 family protein [Streptococcus pluranimalium]
MLSIIVASITITTYLNNRDKTSETNETPASTIIIERG